MKDLKSILVESVDKTELELSLQGKSSIGGKKNQLKSKNPDREIDAWIVNTNNKSYSGKDLKDWNKRDILKYIHDKYRDVFFSEISTPIAHGMFEMATLFDMIQRNTECSDEDVSVAVYGYVNWYFDQHVYNVIERFGCWQVKYINHPQALSSFMSSVRRDDSNAGISEPNRNKVSKGLLDIAYRGTAEKFISMYGAVIVYGYLRACQHLSDDASTAYVRDGMIGMLKSGLFTLEQIIEITNQYNPYSGKFERLDISHLVFNLKNHFGAPMDKMRVDFK